MRTRCERVWPLRRLINLHFFCFFLHSSKKSSNFDNILRPSTGRSIERSSSPLPLRGGTLRKYVYLCRSDAPRCSFRSNCQVKAVLHLRYIRKNERDFLPPASYLRSLCCTFDLLPQRGPLRKYSRVLRYIRKSERDF